MKQPRHIGMREKGDSLIESIARFDIRENQDIGLAVDGRYNAFDVAARLFAGSLYIQRAVDDDISELACLGKFHNIDIIQRMRELGAHLFRTMDKCDTRLFDTEMAAGMDGIPNHLYALLQGGPGNDCGIRKEQQFIIGGNLHDSQMCQNLSFDRLYEVRIMKTHSELGAAIIKDMDFSQDYLLVHTAWEICRWHHERWDGKGYPDGLKGEEILSDLK